MLYILIGIISGFIGGLGIGGGTILIPILVFLMHTQQQIAQSVNLLSFIPLSIVALYIHIKNKNVEFKVAIYIIVFGLIGSILGSKLAVSISSAYLKKYFGVFLLIMGVYQLICKTKD
ncbi:sulfite exporter TauE/SafE family protein [Irregularibacter muris]|uniref:Probable membrane transporter protein n=1 Tax=Irregularibacter muris TaxID=1796619 RepID=A0AAE3HEV8_9FIRM|nr:sulfite exporter TauE/SafE family protein [Irregularibacter muris]MCR1898222.1 sulfite exporter TauE/SafE family protein [Irregularibacter muris]